MYMNDVGIMARTRDLNDALWGALIHGIIGSVLVAFGAILVPLTAYYQCWPRLVIRYNDGGEAWSVGDEIVNGLRPAATFADVLPYVLVSLVLISVGILISRPYWSAAHKLQVHTAAMKAETANLGKGWGAS